MLRKKQFVSRVNKTHTFGKILCGLEIKERSDYNFWSVNISSTKKQY